MTASPNPHDRTELENLKARVDLVELFRQSGLQLKKVGRNHLCRCPFHDDKEASLSVNSEKRLWNCFSCKAGGDALEFLRLKEKLEFPQALARLKDLAGTVLEAPGPVLSPDLLAGELKRAELLERVVDHYARRLRDVPAAQQYLNRRGLDSRELWESFRIGYCDGSLADTLPSEGPVKEALTQLGVLNAKGKEPFRGCVVVPLSHPEQGLVGLYGRRLDPEANVKHQYLPGPHRGILNWQGLKLSSSILLAESVLDALSLWRAGLPEVTCLYGVQGLPQGFEEVLSASGVREVVFCLDGDRAGKEATEKLSRRFLERGLRCLSIELPAEKDPNAVLCERGGEALKQLCRQREAVEVETPAETPRCQSTAEGMTVRFAAVTYQLWPQPPFSSRLRARIRAVKDTRMVMDQVDFYVSRSRKSLTNQLCSQLEISRIEAERHLLALLEQMEGWVQARKNSEAEESETPKVPQLSQEERAEALAFLRQKQLVQHILDDMQEIGYVGEDNAKLLGYLISISRKLERPLSGIVLSQSGAGKSSLTDLIESLTPPEEVVLFSRLSPQALYWMERDALFRRLLILEERVGAEAADYSIRVLQSRQRLTQAVVIKDPTTGKLSTKTFVVEGPVAYLETTTNSRINHENATRCFEITLDESQEQTRRIQSWQRGTRLPSLKDRRQRLEAIKLKHHNAQRILEQVLVYIPYAEHLSFPSRWLRTRRDNERFLCLIEAVAFLHQYQRERGTTDEGTPYVLANLDDYRLAYQLAKDVLATTLHELTREAKDLYDTVVEWVCEQGGERADQVVFSRRDLRTVTGLEDHRLRQGLNELVDMEYLEVITGSTGRAYQYRLLHGPNTQAPASMRELTTPEELERLWLGRRK